MFSETQVKLQCGVSGTLTEPESKSKWIVFIIHGVGGHRDYCYQKMLGHALAENCNLSSWRYDSRGCGESDDVENPENGRSVGGTDYADLDNSYKFFTNEGYRVLAIVAHSRGSSIMFLWALRNPQIFIPYLVNCSGRFHTPRYRTRVYEDEPNYQRDQGYSLSARRYGKYTQTWIPMQEVDEFCSWDSYKYAQIDQRTQILTCFGNVDQRVDPSDCGYWANLFAGRHTLRIICGGDHSFYAGRDANNKKISHNPEVVEAITEWLQSDAQLGRYYAATKQICSPRWPRVEGVENFRDFGGYGNVKSGRLFRSARPDNITANGKKQLVDLGIGTIFDLRSTAEGAQKYNIPGVSIVSAPVFATRDMSPAALAERYAPMLGKDSTRGFEHSYMDILEAGKPVFKQIMDTIRTKPDQGVLVHCTAGKDRTGIFCAVLLRVLGVDAYTAAREYELTTIGWENQRAVVAKELSEQLKGSEIGPENVQHMLSSKFESMIRALELMDQRYKGAYQYFISCGISPEELSQVIQILTEPKHRL